jgi:peptidoglycan-N-acetylglucosamine deacetylase
MAAAQPFVQVNGGLAEFLGAFHHAMAEIRAPRWGRSLLLLLNALLPAPTLVFLASGRLAALWLLLVTLGVHGLLLWAIMAPRCTWLGPLVHRFTPVGRDLWLTLDDGPVGEKTRELSGALRSRGVPATFFFIGNRLAADPEIAPVLQRDGHDLANHTGSHPRKGFWCSWPARVQREVESGSRALEAAGITPRWFRPPVGHKPPALHGVLQKAGLRLISWTVGGRDGWSPDPQNTVARVRAAVRPGSIVVLHEGRAYSNETILAVVDALLADGFRFVLPTPAMLETAA